eukprot:521612-Hanusia_phi.AAC.1
MQQQEQQQQQQYLQQQQQFLQQQQQQQQLVINVLGLLGGSQGLLAGSREEEGRSFTFTNKGSGRRNGLVASEWSWAIEDR